jgi:hypothetical protein
MLHRSRTLRVLPNPYAALDGYGRPAGIVPCDPHEHTPDRRFVGAHIADVVVHDDFPSHELRSNRQDTRWGFATEPVEIPRTHYYVERLREGALFPADEATARMAGIPFESPAKRLEKAKAAALAQWVAHYGEEPDPKEFDL